MLGAGIHNFTKTLLKAFREAVIDPELGLALSDHVTQAIRRGYAIGQKIYKRVPQGYSLDHPLADLLRYSGLTFAMEEAIPPALFSAGLADQCFEIYQDMVPVVTWLQSMKAKAGL